MTPEQLAMVAQYKNGMVSYTTVQQLADLGYPVVPAPLPGQPLHSTVVTPSPLPPDQAAILSQAFSAKIPNPAKR
jgi:hypothetical protein